MDDRNGSSMTVDIDPETGRMTVVYSGKDAIRLAELSRKDQRDLSLEIIRAVSKALIQSPQLSLVR